MVRIRLPPAASQERTGTPAVRRADARARRCRRHAFAQRGCRCPGQYQPVTRINRHRLLRQSGHGDVFRHVLGGAGGWGDPAEGDPALIPHDVAECKLSTQYVRREYGVAADPA
jgi:N-methylhydantoinase B/oxoprolinase/acetone carboxylase alpha subunit